MQLTQQLHFPGELDEPCDRLTNLVERHAGRLLQEEYWSDDHLNASSDHTGQSYTYIRDDDIDCFEDTDEYLYSRFKRCIYHRVTHVLDAHTDEYEAFHFVCNTVKQRKIRRIGWRRLRTQLFEEDSPYIAWGVLEAVVEKLNRYYDRHGRFPAEYTGLVETPEPNGTLPYAPDKGDYHIHNVSVEKGELVFTMNAPDSHSPESHYDWTEHIVRFPIHERFQAMVDRGEVKAPTLHTSSHGYTLDVPVDIPNQSVEMEDGRVLAVDLGVKKQATAVPVQHGHEDCGHEQTAPPSFIDHSSKDKLFRVKATAEGVNDRLAELRRQGKDHTEQFDHLLSEYRRTRRRERRLRHRVQHDVANELVWLAIHHGCEEIVFESLGQLENDSRGRTAWSISTWARGDLLDLVEYKAGLVGLGVETVNPWGTSRYCPRCGERGRTVKAPDDPTECRSGGHFHCSECGYECDRDVVGAVNIGRKHLDECKMEGANPAAYTATGNHASFPSHLTEKCDRSAGVQSATDTQQEQDVASGRQTHLSQYCSSSLTTKRREADSGGLHQNHGSNTREQLPSGSITQYVLARTTECS